MIRVEIVEDFRLKAFDELKNIIRANPKKNEKGKMYVGDTCECSEEMAKYLTGSNPLKKVVVKVLEVEPEVKIDEQKEVAKQEKPKTKKTTKKKKSSK